jgi:hypothetical protein
MPTHRAGHEVRQDPIRFKNLVEDARDRLVEGGMRRPDAESLLQSAMNLLQNERFWRYQDDGLAVFVSPEWFRYYRVPLEFDELVVTSDRFHVKPLMPLLAEDGKFYILAISKDRTRLLQASQSSVSELDLDNIDNIPQGMADALRYDVVEKQVQFHTETAGAPGGITAPAGGRQAMFHGQGSVKEDRKEPILRYFQQVDNGLRDFLQDESVPLIVAAVDYLHPLYQQANCYANLIPEGIVGNPDLLRSEELHQQALEILQPYFDRSREESMNLYHELVGTGKTSNRIDRVVPAAYNQRIDRLFVARDRHQWGLFDPQSNQVQLHEAEEPGDEDLLDFAAAHTFLNNGLVYAIEPDKMPEDASVAAILRF